MEKQTLEKPGAMKLPPGFRFHPTDEELVLLYLRRKVFSYPLPAAVIPEIDMGKSDPWIICGGGEQERYFFHLRTAKYPNGSRSNRATGSGYWKATGKDKPIIVPKGNQVVGMKKLFVFYSGRPSAGSRTDWVMHEYRLAGAETAGRRDWVLCCVFMKKRAARMESEAEQQRIVRFFDFMRENERDASPSRRLSSPSSSLSLSCVTELSEGNGNGEDCSFSSSSFS
ncbi:NAC transcription factor 29 [Apostasia shenzhenica]|uniref:NAC transcription factor 29 n=1 Tax=Apostasia shenzhenica TaxID=1088818 RepID=A0A2I0AMX6_9ASPA|nr:NAC transcription factor 29 [Apostasia shenzhenica]